jgi:hypothetical protein
MKKLTFILCLIITCIFHQGCGGDSLNLSQDCEDEIADLAMTTLEVGASSLITGNPFKVTCIISNGITTIRTCASGSENEVATITSEETSGAVTIGYSETASTNESDYDVLKKEDFDIKALLPGDSQADEIEFTPDRAGYYLCKVEVDPKDRLDEGSETNNNRSIAFRVD